MFQGETLITKAFVEVVNSENSKEYVVSLLNYSQITNCCKSGPARWMFAFAVSDKFSDVIILTLEYKMTFERACASQAVVAHTFYSSTQEAETGKSVRVYRASSRPASAA